MRRIMAGEATPGQIGGFLMAIRTKGETADEVEGLARTMLAFANQVAAPAPVVDVVGTGGDRSGTFNITGLVVAFLDRIAGQPLPAGHEPVRFKTEETSPPAPDSKTGVRAA